MGQDGITKWGSFLDYKVGQEDYKVGQGLQSGAKGLQSGAGITKWCSTRSFWITSFLIYNRAYHKARLAQWGTNGYDVGTYEHGLSNDHNSGC